MFRIKICGITNSQDAQAAIDAGADALGINFYPASKRFVDLHDARTIASVVPQSVVKVGVFVNHSADEIRNAIQALDSSFIQLHGDEPPRLLADLPPNAKIIRAYRCGAHGLAPLARYLENCHTAGRLPDAVLLDSDSVGVFGGSGLAADWQLIARERTLLDGICLILAGGLNPANVGEAIAAVRPNAVDVASGVESNPRKKDHALVYQFVAAAKNAFDKT